MSRRRSRSRYLNENLEELLEMNLFEEDGDEDEGMEDMDIEDILEQMQGEKLEANLESNDLYHLMRNGYTLEEAQEILNEQIGDGSFETAELSDSQINFMNSPMGTPDFFSSYQDYKDMVDSYEEKGFWPFKSG